MRSLAAPFRVAVIGAGPAGFYAAQALLKRFPAASVDIIERLPVPFGLVRYGVAPDHPATRQVTANFSALVERNERLSFYGNVPVSFDECAERDETSKLCSTTAAAAATATATIADVAKSGAPGAIPLRELAALYHRVVVATGAAAPRALPVDTALSVGARERVHAAHDFVLWLNGHPDVHRCGSRHLAFAQPLERSLSTRIAHVGVVGAGNVALDVARLLLQPRASLLEAPVAPAARALLTGQRGQGGGGGDSHGCGSGGGGVDGQVSMAASAMETQRVSVVARRAPRFAAWTTAALREVVAKMPGVVTRTDRRAVLADLERKDLSRAQRRSLTLLADRALDLDEGLGDDGDEQKRLTLHFGLQMSSFDTSPDDELLMHLVTNDEEKRNVTLSCDSCFLSLGYIGGRGSGTSVGWANDKASGIIGDNKWDAETVIESVRAPEVVEARGGVEEWLQRSGREAVTWEGWRRIDGEETRRAEGEGRAGGRNPIESVEEMIDIATQNKGEAKQEPKRAALTRQVY